MGSGRDGILTAIDLAESMGISSTDLPWTPESVRAYLHGRTKFAGRWDDEIEAVTGWSYEDLPPPDFSKGKKFEANEYGWSTANKKNFMLDKDGMEKSDKKNVHKYLKAMQLMEAARGADTLGNMKVYVSRDGGDIELWIADPKEVERHKGNAPKNMKVDSVLNRASIGLFSASRVADCLNGFITSWAHVDEEGAGFGPMLYDIAMEIATAEGGGLLSDRRNVSAEAFAVWAYYADKRQDVIAHQLDDDKGRLTPDIEADDCWQEIAYDHQSQDSWWTPYSEEEEEDIPWDPYGKEVLLKSPLSKLYKSVGSPTIDYLKSSGKWEEV